MRRSAIWQPLVVSYLRRYTEGALARFQPPLGTFTPGTSGIGVIERVGSDVYQLHPGRRVLLTGNYTMPENVPSPARALLGITAPPEFVAVLDTWPDGTVAEQVAVPLSTVTPVPATLDGVPSAVLAAATRCLVPYGGLLRGRLRAGETVVVNGATGGFGSAGVHVALAMGAGAVVAAGRNAAARGRLVLMGSMTTPLPIDYTALMMTGREIIGHFMYPDDAPARLLALVASGLLDLTAIPTRHHRLSDLERAMDEAAAPNAPLVVVGG